jgi:hypothetical protein
MFAVHKWPAVVDHRLAMVVQQEWGALCGE